MASVKAHRGSLRIRWIPRRSEPASEEPELVSYIAGNWRVGQPNPLRVGCSAPSSTRRTDPRTRSRWSASTIVYWQKFSVRHWGCQPVRGAPRHTGDQQLSAAEVAERSQESWGV